MAEWPATLPSPQKQISLTPGDTRKIRDTVSGRKEIRRMGSGASDRIRLLFRLTWAQWTIFKRLYEWDFNLGVNWFSALWLPTLGYTAHKAHFFGYPREVARQQYYVDVIATLLVQPTADIVGEDSAWPCAATGGEPTPPPSFNPDVLFADSEGGFYDCATLINLYEDRALSVPASLDGRCGSAFNLNLGTTYLRSSNDVYRPYARDGFVEFKGKSDNHEMWQPSLVPVDWANHSQTLVMCFAPHLFSSWDAGGIICNLRGGTYELCQLTRYGGWYKIEFKISRSSSNHDSIVSTSDILLSTDIVLIEATFIKDTSNWMGLRVDGVLEADKNTVQYPTYGSVSFRIGDLVHSVSPAMNLRFAMCINRELTSDERTAMHTYMNDNYGTSIP